MTAKTKATETVAPVEAKAETKQEKEANQFDNMVAQAEKKYNKAITRMELKPTETETHKFKKFESKLVSTDEETGFSTFEKVEVDSCEVIQSGKDYDEKSKELLGMKRDTALKAISDLPKEKVHLSGLVAVSISNKLKAKNPYTQAE